MIKAINKKFLEEAKILEKQWTKKGLLGDVKYSRVVTTESLESQRLLNELPGPANFWISYGERNG